MSERLSRVQCLWYKKRTVMCFARVGTDVRWVIALAAFDSQAQLIDETTRERALGRSRAQNVVPRANQATKKADPYSGSTAAPAESASTSVSMKPLLESTSHRITRDVVPADTALCVFSAFQSCMSGSTKHCVKRFRLYPMSGRPKLG